MWESFIVFLQTVMPLLVVIVVPTFSFFGARAGRKQTLEKCTIVLNKQADENIMQYKILRAVVSVLLALTTTLHDAGILNGNSVPIQNDLLAIQKMMEEDTIEQKRNSFYVKHK